MELRRALDSFYYSTALCDLRLMNRQFIDEILPTTVFCTWS